ncbi:MAG: DEAD/DEAH box helicase [Phycisphaerales bacterium]|nr:DEAD/DEAH box helicase [Phycisphaerales bacterium]
MLVIHAVWTRDRLHIWGEDAPLAQNLRRPAADASTSAEASTETSTEVLTSVHVHPFAVTREALASAVSALAGGSSVLALDDIITATEPLKLVLPSRTTERGTEPMPSDRLALALGWIDVDDDILHASTIEVPAIALEAPAALRFLLAAEESDHSATLLGHELAWWRALADLATDLLADMRVVPSLVQEKSGRFIAMWQPWLADGEPAARTDALLRSMPPVVRCCEDECRSQPWNCLEAALVGLVDGEVRSMLVRENFSDAIDERVPETDAHVAWLTGLLGSSRTVEGLKHSDTYLMRGARQWLAQLDDVGEGRLVRLCLELEEPESDSPDAPAQDGRNARWNLQFKLITTDDPPVVIDAQQVWAHGRDGLKGLLARMGDEGEPAANVFLSELARAARIWPRIERALEENEPCGLELSTNEAYAFLRDFRPILSEAGFVVIAPPWWGQTASRLGARLVIDSGSSAPDFVGGATGSGEQSHLGLHSLVDYSWQIALGEQPLSIEEFQRLAGQGSPLLRVGGQWVEIRPEDLVGAMRFLKEHPGGQMTVMQALRLANGLDGADGGLPILGLDSSGWVTELLSFTGNEAFSRVEQPLKFQGTLRPYQLIGVSWLAFLDKFGLGGCLADDMGLGKTVQLIALMQHERQMAGDRVVGPTLLVCPMSVVGNWTRELHRFAPELQVHVHHGPDRPTEENFVKVALSSDVIVTTYALVVRDLETLNRVHWRRVALDEAQHIKNPPTKQTASIRSLRTGHRVALTGTPVENRLSELWSILEFCTPSYLGTNADFRRRFAMPIERHKDRRQGERLKALVRPFILRRLKTDPTVITDLPPLIESRQIVPLTVEQAQLYEAVVAEMLHKVDSSEGIQRRGLVLSALVKLKQICNHPAHFLRQKELGVQDENEDLDGVVSESPVASKRSGKATRLIEMLEELAANKDRALIFTQYRQMGHILVSMIRRELGIEALFLHGGTPQAKRDQLVDRFQSNDPACPFFVLSLKAGGVGLNLTAANHVFHFDRWWNPAVENQATDRAFRIGQHRTVNVHKMMSTGTLEQQIDLMIEQKTELAKQIIGTGEQWLTELSIGQLRDLLSLRRDGVEDED